MRDDDYWQAQMEDERMQRELEALIEIDRAGMHEHAQFLAAELGLSKEFIAACAA